MAAAPAVARAAAQAAHGCPAGRASGGPFRAPCSACHEFVYTTNRRGSRGGADRRAPAVGCGPSAPLVMCSAGTNPSGDAGGGGAAGCPLAGSNATITPQHPLISCVDDAAPSVSLLGLCRSSGLHKQRPPHASAAVQQRPRAAPPHSLVRLWEAGSSALVLCEAKQQRVDGYTSCKHPAAGHVGVHAYAPVVCPWLLWPLVLCVSSGTSSADSVTPPLPSPVPLCSCVLWSALWVLSWLSVEADCMAKAVPWLCVAALLLCGRRADWSSTPLVPASTLRAWGDLGW
jgi:hypothetical protein